MRWNLKSESKQDRGNKTVSPRQAGINMVGIQSEQVGVLGYLNTKIIWAYRHQKFITATQVMNLTDLNNSKNSNSNNWGLLTYANCWCCVAEMSIW